jgi:hypothetical protein
MSQVPHPATSQMKDGKNGDCYGGNGAEYLYPARHFMSRCALGPCARGTVGIRM